MNCIVKGVNCAKEIMLFNNDLEPNIELYSPHTTYFYDFNDKKTITIRPGKINKGDCVILEDDKKEYSFKFTDNEITYNIDKSITINLYIVIGGTEKIANCNLNLSGKENPIICNVDICPNEEDDININNNPDPDYDSLYPNTIYFENFAKSNTTTIINDKNGMIIKGEINDNTISFIITENIVNENDLIENEFNFELKINKGKANCTVPKLESKDYKFNIFCSTSDLSVEDEIEIIEEPEYEEYYFSGYKNKKTLSLIPGSIMKEIDDNKFLNIYNNIIKSSIEIEENVEFKILYNINDDEGERTTSCNFNTKDIVNNTANITCEIEDINNLETITILNNPEPILLIKNKITLHFNKFEELSLLTLTLGKIRLYGCNKDINRYIFYLDNTTLSKSINNDITMKLPVIMNGEVKDSFCSVRKNQLKYNMYCNFRNYCPNDGDFIDLQVETNNYNDINLIKPNTIFIKINEDISTSILLAGSIEKEGCYDGFYHFKINNNEIKRI